MLKVKLKFTILFAFLLSHLTGSAQNDYKINLSVPSKKINTRHYYFESVIDRRQQPNNNGKILSVSGKSVDVRFASGIDSVLIKYIQEIVQPDSNLVPVHLVIEALNFTDVGNSSKHKLNLNLKFSVIRNLEGKEFTLYGSSGSPGYSAQGITHGLAEELLSHSIESLLTGFDDYSKSNFDQQAFCNRTESTFIFDKSYTDYKNADTIRWKKDYKLTWEDFQGKPDRYSSFSAQSNCMFSYKATIDYSDGLMKMSLFLYPCFTKKASWVVKENKQDGLLAHEQMHFDICELYMRKLRQEISTLKLSILSPGEQIRQKFDTIWADYQQAQALYDDETQHGLIEIMQKRWELNVRNELIELERFATR